MSKLQDYDLCDDCGASQDECNNDLPAYPICFTPKQQKHCPSCLRFYNCNYTFCGYCHTDLKTHSPHQNAKSPPKPELRNLITNAKSVTYSYFYANPNDFTSFWRKNWNSKHRC